MPCLPKSLAAVRTAVASLLRSSDRAGSLHGADNITVLLNIAADVSSDAGIDVTMLLRAFANKSVDEHKLKYNEYFRCVGMGMCSVAPCRPVVSSSSFFVR